MCEPSESTLMQADVPNGLNYAPLVCFLAEVAVYASHKLHTAYS